MTKQEAKKLLYVFLKRHNIAYQYYYNCITCNKERYRYRIKYLEKPKKECLKLIMDDHINAFLGIGEIRNLKGFFSIGAHTFNWYESKEGYRYWENMYFKWEKEMKEYSTKYIETK
jgi:hypothetical protein